jgi:hypothetical protein
MKQITIVCQERTGLVAEITAALGSAGINIETIDAEAAGGMGVVILTVDKYDDALRALHLANFHPVTEDAILVRLSDEPGALAAITKRFKDAKISLRSVRFIQRNEGSAIVAIGVERTEEAMALVRDVLIA